jgi:hypothetical protein
MCVHQCCILYLVQIIDSVSAGRQVYRQLPGASVLSKMPLHSESVVIPL